MNKLITPQWRYFSLLFLILSGNIAGQVFDSRPEAVWLRQDSATLDSLPTVYVGNHSILKKEAPETLSKLKFISQTNYGSLFIVLQPSVSGFSEEVLMRLGQIKLFRDHLQVNGKQLEIPAMDSPQIIGSELFLACLRALSSGSNACGFPGMNPPLGLVGV